MNKATILIILLVISHIALGQSNGKADSLIEYSKSVPDTLKAKTYNDICWALRYTDTKTAMKYGMLAEEIAKKTDDRRELCRSYSFVGVCQRNLGNYSKAMEYFNLHIEESKKNNFKDEVVWSYNNAGGLFNRQGNYDMAIEYEETAEKNALELCDSNMLGYIYDNLGEAYRGKKDYKKSLDFFNKSLNIRIAIHTQTLRIAGVRKEIGKVYLTSGELDSAKYYLYQCVGKVETDCDMTSDMYWLMAQVYYKVKDYDSAQYCGEKALENGFNTQNKERIMNAYGILGDIAFVKGNYLEASENYSEQIAYNDSIFNEDLTHKIFDIQFTTEQNQKQDEIDQINENKKIQIYMLLILGGIIVIGVTFALLMIRNSKKIKMLNTDLKRQHSQIKDSINYAQKIQKAIMPKNDEIMSMFSDKFVIFNPRDIVSGDFYWSHEDAKYQMVAVADCTGHGVPGACMSMIGTSLLHGIAEIEKNPADILELLRMQIKKLLHQTKKSTEQNDDGMDIGLTVIDKSTRTLRYSGAFIPLWYIRDGKINHLKATKNPVGGYVKEVAFKTLELKLESGDCIYMTTDGYCSQFGGDGNTKLSTNTFKDMLVEIHKLPMKEQAEIIQKTFSEWRGNCEQTDDVCIVGFRNINE